MSGLFITFEGVDFCGKSTQAQKLTERLSQAGREVLFVREPGGTAISEAVRDILLDNRFVEMHKHTELLLYGAARAQIVAEQIKPALANGKIVVCDRYIDSTTAYQGYGRKIDLSFTTAVNKIATQGLEPDCTFLIDLPVEIAEERRIAGGKQKDRLEIEAVEFYQNIRQAYLDIAKKEKHRYVVLDGKCSIGEIENKIDLILQRRL